MAWREDNSYLTVPVLPLRLCLRVVRLCIDYRPRCARDHRQAGRQCSLQHGEMSTVTSYQGSYLGDIDDSYLIATLKGFVEKGSSINIIPSYALTGTLQDFNIANSLQIGAIVLGVGVLVLVLFYVFCIVAKSLSCTISPKISPGLKQIDIANKYAYNYKLGRFLTYSFGFLAILFNQLLLLCIIPIISPNSPLLINGVNNIIAPLAYLTSLFEGLKSNAVALYQYGNAITKLTETADSSCATFQSAVSLQLAGFTNASATLKTETTSFFLNTNEMNTTVNEYLDVLWAYLLVLALYILPTLSVAATIYGVKRSNSTVTNCAVNFSAIAYLAMIVLCVGFLAIAGALATACDGDVFNTIYLYIGASQEKVDSMRTYFECTRGDVPHAFSSSIDDARNYIGALVSVCDSYLKSGCTADASITSIRSSLVGSVNTTLTALEGAFSCPSLKSSAYSMPIETGLCIDMIRSFLVLWLCQQSMAMFMLFMFFSATFACQYFDHARQVFPEHFSDDSVDETDVSTVQGSGKAVQGSGKAVSIADIMKTIDEIGQERTKKRKGRPTDNNNNNNGLDSDSDSSKDESKASADEEQGGAGYTQQKGNEVSAASPITRTVLRASGSGSSSVAPAGTAKRRGSGSGTQVGGNGSDDEAEVVSVRSAVSVRSFRSARSVNTDNVYL